MDFIIFFPRTRTWCMNRYKTADAALDFVEQRGQEGVVWRGPKRVARWTPEGGREFFFARKLPSGPVVR